MAEGRFPRAYDSNVKVDRGMMEYVPFEKMDIGARASGLPKNSPNEIKSLEHVGGVASGTAKKI